MKETHVKPYSSMNQLYNNSGNLFIIDFKINEGSYGSSGVCIDYINGTSDHIYYKIDEIHLNEWFKVMKYGCKSINNFNYSTDVETNYLLIE